MKLARMSCPFYLAKRNGACGDIEVSHDGDDSQISDMHGGSASCYHNGSMAE